MEQQQVENFLPADVIRGIVEDLTHRREMDDDSVTNMLRTSINRLPTLRTGEPIRWDLMDAEMWRRFVCLVHQYVSFPPGFSRNRQIHPIIDELTPEEEVYSFNNVLPGLTSRTFANLMAKITGRAEIIEQWKEWRDKQRSEVNEERRRVNELTGFRTNLRGRGRGQVFNITRRVVPRNLNVGGDQEQQHAEGGNQGNQGNLPAGQVPAANQPVLPRPLQPPALQQQNQQQNQPINQNIHNQPQNVNQNPQNVNNNRNLNQQNVADNVNQNVAANEEDIPPLEEQQNENFDEQQRNAAQ